MSDPVVNWSSPPAGPLRALSDGVDLWLVDASLDDAGEAAARTVLSPDELARCDRLLVPAKRIQATAVRAALRHILSRYTGASPRELSFEYGEHEKPALAAPATPGLEFNVSHSGVWGLVGVTAGRPVGVDIEQIRPLHNADGLARTVLASAELEQFAAADETARLDFLFNRWACKEAALKAAGVGMSVAPANVACRAAGNARFIAELNLAGQSTRWNVTALTPAAGYSGAVALPEGALCNAIRAWRHSA
ncbi:MAG: 4'-phosphopantetheinyl transferase superfamily protein [Planctomycetales bacterium]|nr:4'-phosphopantetheinyl transferase superfamily protein [Planctomycetales bacterium]